MDTIAFQVKMRRLALGAGSAALLAACAKQPEAALSPGATPPPASPAPNTTFTASAIAEQNPTPAAEPTVHVLPASDGPADALPEFPLALEALYFTETTPLARRDEIVRALGRIDTAESIAVLGRIFDRDKRLDARMGVIQVAAEFKSDAAFTGKLAIFTRAVAPTQAQVLRLSALQTLAEIDDPSVPPLLHTLAVDPSATIREAAQAVLNGRRP